MTRHTDDTNQDLAAGFVLDDLSPEEAARLAQILAGESTLSPETDSQTTKEGAEEIKAEIKSFQDAISLLPYALPAVAPPAGLKGKILSAARNSVADTSATGTSVTGTSVTGTSVTDSSVDSSVIGSPVVGSSAASSSESSFRSNVVSITSARQSSGQSSRQSREQRSWQRWMPALSTGIAAVAVAALGLGQLRSGSQQSTQTVALQQQLDATNAELNRLRSELQAKQGTIALLSEPGTQVLSLVGEPSDPTKPDAVNSSLATARVLAKPGDRQVTLVAQGLPTLPEDKVYRFWSLTEASAEPTYCGEFRPDGDTAQWVVPDAICTETPLQLMITLDSPNDPHILGGQVVMQGTT
jgi:hypothetical protein